MDEWRMQLTKSPNILSLCSSMKEIPAWSLEDEVARNGGEALELRAISAGQKAYASEAAHVRSRSVGHTRDWKHSPCRMESPLQKCCVSFSTVMTALILEWRTFAGSSG